MSQELAVHADLRRTVLIVALLSLAIWAVTRIWSGPEPTLPTPASIEETTPTPEAGEATTSAEVKPAPKPASKAQPFTLTVKISDTGASWLRVSVDGQPAYEGVLTAGQTKEFEVAEKAGVRIGKPEAVTIYKDGEQVRRVACKGSGFHDPPPVLLPFCEGICSV